jgi:PAS domain S-box-containing protein
MAEKPTYEQLESRVKELERKEEELSQIFSMSLDMICIADIKTATFVKVNPAFIEILGYSEKELLEKSFLEFIHPEDIDATRTLVEKKLQEGAKVINFENRYRCKNGTYR